MNRLVLSLSAALLALAATSCSSLCPYAGEADGRLQHVVLFWLKDPGNAEHRAQLIEACESFDSIPAVRSVRVGEVIAGDRDIIDSSYDIGLIVAVDDPAGLTAYLEHPDHVAARDDVLLPVVEKVIVYDFQK